MERREPDGLLLLDKAVGMTSHDAVALARRALGTRRIGHAGTLDPFASGLLVLLVGKATRLLPYLDAEPKVYRASIAFGAATDTDDHTGTIVRTAPLPSRESIDAALPTLTGAIRQRPPAYSAKKVAGVRAYDAARRGEALILEPVAVEVHRWEVLRFAEGHLDVEITCGGGTYIRALARDLGETVGSAAHLTALRRLRSGPFDVEMAADTASLSTSRPPLRSTREAVATLPAQPLSPPERARITRGMAVPATVAGNRAALVDEDGALLAIAERDGDSWQPRVVLAGEAPNA